MAAMCRMDGCSQKKGMCLHEKLMVFMGVVMIAAAGAHWGLHLV